MLLLLNCIGALENKPYIMPGNRRARRGNPVGWTRATVFADFCRFDESPFGWRLQLFCDLPTKYVWRPGAVVVCGEGSCVVRRSMSFPLFALWLLHKVFPKMNKKIYDRRSVWLERLMSGNKLNCLSAVWGYIWFAVCISQNARCDVCSVAVWG